MAVLEQQMQSVTQAMSPMLHFAFSECTMHLRNERWHVHFADFHKICGGDGVNADALRVADMQTTKRIKELRRRFGLSASLWPHDDDMWFNAWEWSTRNLQTLSAEVNAHSTYRRSFREPAQLALFDAAEMPEEIAGTEESEEDEREPERPRGKPSLLDLGFVKQRYIARPTGYKHALEPATTLWVDDRGPFIVVNMNGEYLGDDGQVHDALNEGFAEVWRQFRYDFDATNAAIAELAYLDPPEPLPRVAEPLTVRKRGPHKNGGLAQKTTTFAGAQPAPQHDDYQQISANKPAQGGSKRTGVTETPIASHAQKDTIDITPMSSTGKASEQTTTEPGESSEIRENSKEKSMDFRVAPWCAETIRDLSSHILKIPDPAKCDPEAYERDWGAEQWQRIYEATQGHAPQRAWEIIDTVEQYMETPGSPSWWQRRPGHQLGWRKTKVPVTARNVADHLWEQWEDYLHCGGWTPDETTPYDGPSWPHSGVVDGSASVDYGVGYGGSETPETGHSGQAEQVLPNGAEPQYIEVTAGTNDLAAEACAESQAVEVTAGDAPLSEQSLPAAPPEMSPPLPSPSLSHEEADELMAAMMAQFPLLRVDLKEKRINCFAVRVEYAEGRWCYFDSFDAWYAPEPEIIDVVNQAIAFARSLVPRRGMSVEDAIALADFIKAKHPTIILDFEDLEEDDVRLHIQHSASGWMTIKNAEAWRNPAPVAIRMRKDAIAFGEAMAAQAQAETPDDPGDEETPGAAQENNDASDVGDTGESTGGGG